MLVFDQLKKNDAQLRVIALVVLAGLGILLAGLWWVQIVSVRSYQANLETQSFRTVRIPAVRGKILDRGRAVLAENRPTYNVSLYLEDLRKPFDAAYVKEVTKVRADLKRQMEEQEKALNRSLNKQEKKKFVLTRAEKNVIRKNVRYQVVSNLVAEVGERLQLPISLVRTNFERHYETRLVLPYTVISNLDPTNIARFAEQGAMPGVDLEVQSTRAYPFQTTAAHLLGHLKRDDSATEGEDAYFFYYLPDYRGLVGIEFGYDKELRGLAGAKSVLVNNVGYRQTENVWSAAEPGQNVVLTIDLRVQQTAERALQSVFGPGTKGAVVVLDVRSGDVLALASSPTFNPNWYVQGVSRDEWRLINELQAEKNRATYETYAPGSIFKMVVGLAALENGLNPNEIVHVPPNPAQPNRGFICVGRRTIRDTVPPGDYNFRRALFLSSNTYFITNGLRLGPEKIVRLAQKFHLGERIELPLRQESSGNLPTLRRVSLGWTDGNTANLCIGQAPILVTPLQVALMTAAVANGGKVLWPRFVDRIEPQDPSQVERRIHFPHARVRDELNVSARSMGILHEAMLADTEDPDGTGKHVRDHAPLSGLRICAKTGTAEVQDENNAKTGRTTWFASFAPYGSPRYAVVVMVENGESGGKTCAPVAGLVYQAILQSENEPRPGTLARHP
jgi:penicillin-binding protein 2